METKSALPSDVHITRGMATMVDILVICLLAACGNGSVTRQPGPVAGNGNPGATCPPPTLATAVHSSGDVCFTPGGAASDSLWGQVDLGSFAWVAGIGGTAPTFLCKTNCARPGFTCSCATAFGADLTGADFSNAYLFGVDFTGATYDKASSDQSVICKNNATVDPNW